MTVIGITGQSGSGKSLLAAALAKRGYLHADADAIYHDLLETSEPMRAELVAAFGDDILHKGKIDRKTLAAKVFGKGNAKKLKALNKITHKYVCRECVRLIRTAKDAGEKGVLLDAPLLIEARLDKLCDLVVCVFAPEAVRLARIAARDGLTEAEALRRLRAQPNAAFYAEKCDFAFYNGGDRDAAEAAANEIDRIAVGEANA